MYDAFYKKALATPGLLTRTLTILWDHISLGLTAQWIPFLGTAHLKLI